MRRAEKLGQPIVVARYWESIRSLISRLSVGPHAQLSWSKMIASTIQADALANGRQNPSTARSRVDSTLFSITY